MVVVQKLINSATKTENDKSWQVSTWTHRAYLAAGCTAVLTSLAKSLRLLTRRASAAAWLESASAALLGYVLADLGSGIYHWAIDNYGNPKTPIFGPQIEGFEGHHRRPWRIARQHVAANLHLAAAAVAAAVLPIAVISGDPPLLAFAAAFGGSEILSQHFNAWAHTPRRRLPAAAAALQAAGILLSPSQHAAHHRPPHRNNYCIVSGVWNGLLDRSGFFLGLEVVLDRVFGCRPRSWGEPNNDSAQFSGS